MVRAFSIEDSVSRETVNETERNVLRSKSALSQVLHVFMMIYFRSFEDLLV